MKKSVPVKNLKPEPSMSDKAKAVFVKKSKSKPAASSKVSEARAELDKHNTYMADAAAYRSKNNKIGAASARHIKQVVTGNKAQYLLDQRMEAAQHSRSDSERYEKAYKATKDYAAKRRSKK